MNKVAYNFLFFEPGNLDGLVYLILFILFGPPVFLGVIGFILWQLKHSKAAKIFFILAGVYLVVGLGFCGLIIMGG